MPYRFSPFTKGKVVRENQNLDLPDRPLQVLERTGG